MQKINWKRVFFLFIWLLITGLLLYSRFLNLGWGLPYPMHPDERNMANAVQALNWREGFNPHFFAYGQFPLYLGYIGVIIMKFFDGDLGTPISFQEAVLSLRIVSALSSIITTFVLLGILGRFGIFGKKNIIHYSLFIILIIFSPVLIQFAHFGTTESLLILFYSLIIYFSMLFLQKKLLTTHYSLLTSLFCGLALATKVSSVIFLILPMFVLITYASRSYNKIFLFSKFVLLTIGLFLLFSPHSLLSWNEFMSSMRYESAVASGQVKVFYTRQFENTAPILFHIKKIFPYALGWPVFLLGVLGFLGISWKKKEYHLLRFAFIVVFLPNAFMFAKWTRFMAPAFPVIIIFAILFLRNIVIPHLMRNLNYIVPCFRRDVVWIPAGVYPVLRYGAGITLIIGMTLVMILPGIAYLSVYRNPDVRFQASEWMYKNIPIQSTILSETENVVDIPINNSEYNLISFNFYDLDQNGRLQQDLQYYLTKADYIIVPSRRLFKNHPKESYPLLNMYYQKLFSGELGFKEIARFESFPKICLLQVTCYMFNDEDAEETWTVFDHPVIRIFKRS